MTTFIKSVYAGFMIGVGGCVYLSADNKIAGSLLFSFGLLTIVVQGFSLYTGKIGFVSNVKELMTMPIIILGNFTGTFLMAMFCKVGGLGISTEALCTKKLGCPLWSFFALSVLCGIMMYLAIDNYRKTKNVIFIIAPVMIFILSGFEHSIANLFYFSVAGMWNGKTILWLLVNILGNGIGAWVYGWGKENLDLN